MICDAMCGDGKVYRDTMVMASKKKKIEMSREVRIIFVRTLQKTWFS